MVSRHALNGIAKWQTKLPSNCVRSPRSVLTTITQKKKNWKRWDKESNAYIQIVLKCLYLVRIGRPDRHSVSVHRLAPALTKWTRACDGHLDRVISYIHNTSGYTQFVMWNIRRSIVDWDCSKTLIVLATEDSKSTWRL